MNINIIGMAYSGQAVDAALLQHELEKLGHSINIAYVEPPNLIQRTLMKTGLHKWRRPKFDLNIFIQQPRKWWIPLAKKSVVIPNPDWIDQSEIKYLVEIDNIWCKTQHAMDIFRGMGRSVRFLSFSSPKVSFQIDDSKKNYRGFLHVGGSSELKGTQALIDLWRINPDWPKIIVLSQVEKYKNAAQGVENIKVISQKIDAIEVESLRRKNGIHIQMSETEGYGHVISESLRCGGVVVTLDAEPMNELVQADIGFLVEAEYIGMHYLAKRYAPKAASFSRVIQALLASSPHELEEKSTRAASRYLENARGFQRNLSSLVAELG